MAVAFMLHKAPETQHRLGVVLNITSGIGALSLD